MWVVVIWLNRIGFWYSFPATTPGTGIVSYLKAPQRNDPKVHSRPFRLEGRKIQTGAPSSVGHGPLVAGPGLAGCDSSAHDVPALGSGCPTAGPDCGPSTRYDAGQSFVG